MSGEYREEESRFQEKFSQFADILASSRKVAVFTGAGVSTLSGIPDFRGSHGVYNSPWRGLNVEEILSLDYTVSHGNIFRMPKGIFGIKDAVLEHRILDILEGVFSFHPHVIKMQMGSAHHKIFAFGATVFHFNPSGRPSELRRNHIAAAHNNVRTFAQGLDPMKLCIFNGDVVRVPQSRPAMFRHL